MPVRAILFDLGDTLIFSSASLTKTSYTPHPDENAGRY